MKQKLTKKDKQKAERIKKKLQAAFCKEVNSFGDCICPHCGGVDITVIEEKNGEGFSRCARCDKKILLDNEIKQIITERQDRLTKLMHKVTHIKYGDIDVVEAGLGENCDIEELALLCKYFRCSVAKLSSHIKSLIIKT